MVEERVRVSEPAYEIIKFVPIITKYKTSKYLIQKFIFLRYGSRNK